MKEILQWFRNTVSGASFQVPVKVSELNSKEKKHRKIRTKMAKESRRQNRS